MTRQSFLLFLGALFLCSSLSAKSHALPPGSQWVTAGERIHIYDPSSGETGPWYFNDHTFFWDQATSTWHLFGITNAEPFIPYAYDVDAEKQFGHATAPSLMGPWTKRPFALLAYDSGPSAPASYYHETHLWAPHVIFDQGVYYMFYAGGGPNQRNQEISLATSTDLYTWTRESGGPLFRDGFQARDPMVIKHNGQWIMYYTATLNPQTDSNYVVAYRTSSDLKHWSGRQIAFQDPLMGTDAGPTESPYVLKRGDLFYLFLGPRPYHFYLPPVYPGTDVFVSSTPQFDIKQQVGHISAHAAEVIDDGTRLWVSDAGWGLGGVWLAPLDFRSEPVSGTKLYARAANGDVKRWTGTAQTWTTIGNSSSKLVTGGFGTFSVRTSGSIYRYSESNNGWTLVGGARTDFAVNAKALYARDSGGVYKWSGTGTNWDRIGDAVTAIYAGGNELYATFSSGNFHWYDESHQRWVEIGGPGSQYVANANAVYGLNAYGVFQWTGIAMEWVQVGGAADKLYAGGTNLYATVPFFGSLNVYDNSPDSWSSAASAATSFAVCDDALYALRSNGVFKKNGSAWTQVGPVVASIACGR